MRYWVVDSETTGVGPDDKAVEVAGFLWQDDKLIRYYSSLVDPGIPIPPEASAIHHLTDEDVKGQPDIDTAMSAFFEDDFDFVVAHSASFDKRFMDFGQAPWACSLKLSRAVYPDLPNHKNQFLRYALKLPKLVYSYHEQAAAHRALYDSEVTLYLFHHLLTKATSDDPIAKMLQVSNNPSLLKTCRFGKHKDKLWKDVPRDYLDYIINKSSGWDEDTLYTARYHYENR
jgi:exodeoxyribonuclease X